MNNLIEVRNSVPTKVFEWRSTGGVFSPIDQMETRHLFMTLRMIWNHSMPEEARSKHYREYYFSSFYTKDYLGRAIRNILPELLKREDIAPSWAEELDVFASYLNRNI